MNITISRHGLGIDSPIVTPSSANYRPHTWPPPKDFPVVIDANGKIISRYEEGVWDLTPWAKKALRLDFGDKPKRKGDPVTTSINADLLRQITAWWLWGPQAVRTASSLKRRFAFMFPLFVLCSKENINASDLWRYPKLVDQLPRLFPPSSANATLNLLHALFEQSDQLGFIILNREGLRRLEAALPEHEAQQTPYIPPRIWTYQLNRLRKFLDDFHAHRGQLEACFHFCLDAYAKYYGSHDEAFKVAQQRKKRSPFSHFKNRIGSSTNFEYEGTFSTIAQRFGIDELLRRWLLKPGESLDGAGRSVITLSSYFTMVGKVGTAYLLNFSMMRIDEAWSLRTDCLQIERDERFGEIYLLCGITTKTIDDDDSRWVTSPSTKVAVDAMSCVARLRMIAADADPKVPTTAEELCTPFLVPRHYEPWANSKNSDQPLQVRPIYASYQDVIRNYPNLFESKILHITETDLQIARLITPSLNAKVFKVGKVWPFSWHQLRRTGAVNMQASGRVSDASVQYQLKHATRAMSLYYGQGYSRIRLNDKARTQYIRTMYEILAKEIVQLFSDRFVSPYGDQRKAEILKLVDSKEAKKLIEAAESGKVTWRETLLGGCTKRGPCEYGGIDNVARCSGGDGYAPCVDALFDREKEPNIRKLGREIALRLSDAPVGSPYRESLNAQQRAVEKALDAITAPKSHGKGRESAS